MYEPTKEHVEMWNRGWSCNRIAVVAGVCRSTVCRAMKRRGADLMNRPSPVILEVVSECRKLRDSGVAMRDIADIIGYSRRQIQRWLNPKDKPL